MTVTKPNPTPAGVTLARAAARGSLPERPVDAAPVGSAPEASPWPVLRRAIRPWRWRVMLAVLVGALASAASVALMGTAAWLIATAAGQPPVLTLMVAIVMVRTFGISRGVLRYLERLLSHDVAFRVLGTVRSGILRALTARIEAGQVLGRRSDLLGRAVSDVDDLQDMFLRGLLPWASAVLVGIGASVATLLILPAAGAGVVVAMLVGVVVLPVVVARSTVRREQARVALRAERDALVTETVDQVTDLVALGGWDRATQALTRLDERDRGLIRSAARSEATGNAAAVLVTGAAVVWSLYVGTSAVVDGAMGAVWLAVLALLPLALTEVVAGAGEAVGAVARSRAAAARLAGLLDASEPADADAAVAAAGAAADADADPVSGTDQGAATAGGPVIRLEGVTARWPGRDADTLAGVDLELRPGATVAVVGPSGVGKSTLAAVLLGLLPIRSGRITVDGVPITDRAALRGLMSWADQRAHVFGSSIAENVRLARPGSDDDAVLEAVRRAGLGEWVAGLPDGLDTLVGEHGLAVSGGQRQRIALARALLADRPVLIADEITANLDPATADDVTDEVLTGVGQRCVVLISHRPADADRADTVLRLGSSTPH